MKVEKIESYPPLTIDEQRAKMAERLKIAREKK